MNLNNKGLTSSFFNQPKRSSNMKNKESEDTFIDPREILKKDNLIERKLPPGAEFHDEGRFNLEKNKYYKDFKSKWDNEMYYVMQEY
jgi:hypothetical protein